MSKNPARKLAGRVAERRKHRRYYIDLPIDSRTIEDQTTGSIQVGIAESAGIEGFSVYLDDRMPPGTRLMIELYYRDDCKFCSLKVLTKVIWSSEEREAIGHKHGLKSLKIEKGGNLKLRSILKHCAVLM